MTKRIQIQVLKLTDGRRLLRSSEKESGSSHEKRLDRRRPARSAVEPAFAGGDRPPREGSEGQGTGGGTGQWTVTFPPYGT